MGANRADFMGWLVQLMYALSMISLIILSPSLALAPKRVPLKPRVPKLLTLDIRMPGASPKQASAHECVQRVSKTDAYIKKVDLLNATADVHHHMFLMRCWPSGPPPKNGPCVTKCKRKEWIFAWARNAPGAEFPKDVGFLVRSGEVIRLEVHYQHALVQRGIKDHVGMRIHYTQERPKYQAGIMFLGAGPPPVPPRTASDIGESSCVYSSSKAPLQVFAARAHAHNFGHIISGYKYIPKLKNFELIAKGNPQFPQAFYPRSRTYTINPGDTLAIRCVYSNKLKDRGDKAEMCNLYLMYYTKWTKKDQVIVCGSAAHTKLPALPYSSLVPLRPNPDLEEYALGKSGRLGYTLPPIRYLAGPHAKRVKYAQEVTSHTTGAAELME
jgi:peptidylamidoglycolate lyase